MGCIYTVWVQNHITCCTGVLRPYLFEKLLLRFILQHNVSVGRQKKQKKTASNYRFRHAYDFWSQFIIY